MLAQPLANATSSCPRLSSPPGECLQDPLPRAMAPGRPAGEALAQSPDR